MQSISCYTSRTFGLQPGPGCAALCREHRGSPARPAGEAGACSGCGRTGATVGPTCRPGPRSLSRSRAGAGGTAWDGVQARDLVRTVHECSPPRPRPPCPPLGGSAGHSASAPLPAPVPPPRVGLTSGGKPRLNFLRLNTPFAGWLPLGPWARSRKPRCRNPASGRPKRTPSSHQVREAQALACGSHSSSSPSGSARGAAHRGLRDPVPRPTRRPVPGGTGPARRQAVTGRGRAPWRAVPAVGREAGAFSGGRGGLGGSDSVCCVQGVSPVGSGSIGCKLAPRNVLELTEESFPSEQRFTKCVSPQSCPVSRALRVRVEERPFGGLTVHRLAGPGLSGPLTRDGVDRPGRAQQGAFPTHARTGGPGADGREGRVFSRMHLSATPSRPRRQPWVCNRRRVQRGFPDPVFPQTSGLCVTPWGAA